MIVRKRGGFGPKLIVAQLKVEWRRMAIIEDALKSSPVQAVGLGLLAFALPFFVPAIRPQFAAILKIGAKLFLEAEFEADGAIIDELVDATLDSLLNATSQGSEEERKRAAEHQLGQFLSAARAGARRRGWHEEDAKARYHRHLAKLEHGIRRVHHRAHHSQHAALAHASQRLATHRTKAKP
jgi:hypothetical protein